jgi:hypothetical protein
VSRILEAGSHNRYSPDLAGRVDDLPDPHSTVPAPITNTANVGVALAAIGFVTVGPSAETHCPVSGLV